MPPDKKRFLSHAAIAVAMLAIFAIDMQTPLGLGIPFLYLLLALFAIGIGASNRVLVAIAVLGTLLAAVKLLAPPENGVVWFGQANRLIFFLLIWLVVGLEWVRRLLEAGRQANSQALERLVEERTEALSQANRQLENEVAERKQAEQTILDYTRRLHALANQLVEAQEAERKALATELHDRIGQNLSALNMSLNLDLALLTAQLPPVAMAPIQARIKDSLALVERTTEIVRGVMEELHPALLEQYGLDTALHWYAEEFAGRTGLGVRCLASEPFPRLRSKVETALFRIVQEALTNVAKHAGATEVVVSVQRTNAGIELRVSDNGCGVAPEKLGQPAAGSAWGLTIMAERARSLGAAWRIGRNDGKGSCVVVAVPDGLWEIE